MSDDSTSGSNGIKGNIYLTTALTALAAITSFGAWYAPNLWEKPSDKNPAKPPVVSATSGGVAFGQQVAEKIEINFGVATPVKASSSFKRAIEKAPVSSQRVSPEQVIPDGKRPILVLTGFPESQAVPSKGERIIDGEGFK